MYTHMHMPSGGRGLGFISSMIYIDEVWTSVVRYATILRRGSPRAPAEELLQDEVLTHAGRSSDWAELRTWLGSG